MLLTLKARIEQQNHMLTGMDVKQNFEANFAQNRGPKRENMSGGKGLGNFGYGSGYGYNEKSGNNDYKEGYGNSSYSGNAFGINAQHKSYQGDNQRGGGN